MLLNWPNEIRGLWHPVIEAHCGSDRGHPVRSTIEDDTSDRGAREPTIAAMSTEITARGQAQQQLLGLLAGKMVSATICTLARIGLADHLTEGPRPVSELATATGTDPDMLYRFLRTAAGVGLFSEHADRSFGLTETGALLRSDVDGSLRYLAYLYGEESVWNCFAYAADTLRTGKPAGPALRGGRGWFEYMADSPEYAEVFHRAMTGVSNRAPEVAASYDFGRYRTIADIGGGQGRLLSAILAANPQQRGVLFDTESAIGGADPVLTEFGVRDRVECVVGDFFDSVPAGADAYLLKAILHDWNDADSVRILRNIRAVSTEDTRVYVIEAVVPGAGEWHFSKAMDIAMAVSLGGKERELAEWRDLFAQADFELVDTVRTAPPHWLIKARPIPRTPR